MTVSRRTLLKSLVALGAGGAAARTLAGQGPDAPVQTPPAPAGPAGRATEAAYREEFAATYGDGESHGHAYHCVNCQGNCAWDVWTDADGRITRENQSASYPAIAPDVPDANPRGCNKGVQQSQVLYQADRLLHPMRRTGARGEGKWKRISWDEAITEVATHLYETMLETGPAGNYVHMGSGMLSEARAASVKRLGTLLGAVRPYIASYVGDMFPGVSVVYGEGNLGCTYDFVYGSDVALFWGCNPNTSRIPDAHYLWEGKYRGAKIIVVTPEYNATAIHADLWVPVKPGYDGHLALSIIQRLVATKRYSEPFLKQFTDLPLLVRTDTKQLVRLHDIDPADPRFDRKSAELFAADHEKHHEVFLAWDRNQKKVVALPGCEGSTVDTLRLTDIAWKIDPALSGKFRIRLAGKGEVEVEPAFASFVRELQAYTPEKTAKVTGVHPSVVEQLAKELSGSRVAIVDPGLRGREALQRHAVAAGRGLAHRLPGQAGPVRRPRHRERVEHQRPGGALRLRREVHPPLRLRLRLRVHAGGWLLRRGPGLRRCRREARHRNLPGRLRRAGEGADRGLGRRRRGEEGEALVEGGGDLPDLRRRPPAPEQGGLQAGLPRQGEVHRLRRLPDERLRHLGGRPPPLHHLLRGLGPPHQPRLPPLRQPLRPARQPRRRSAR